VGWRGLLGQLGRKAARLSWAAAACCCAGWAAARPAAVRAGLARVPQAEENGGRQQTSNRWAASKTWARKAGGLGEKETV
jgi:hypothetical protein